MHREPSKEQQPDQAPGLWVGSLSDYADGVLHGSWINPAREASEIEVDIDAMLARSPTAARTGQPAEEFGIFDYDGFGPLRLGEYESLDHVSRIARGITTYGPSYAGWASIAESGELDDYEERFVAHVASVDEYVEEMLDDLGYDELLDRAIPPSLRPYVSIDTHALSRDMQLGGDITPVSDGRGGYWLFHNH